MFVTAQNHGLLRMFLKINRTDHDKVKRIYDEEKNYKKNTLCFTWDDPAEQITMPDEESNISIATPRLGETVNISNINNYQEKWWHEIK